MFKPQNQFSSTDRPIGCRGSLARLLPGSLPALLAIGLVLGATAWAATESDQEKTVRYQALAKEAMDKNCNEQAAIYYERLLQLGQPNAELLFGLARVLNAQGQSARAAAMLNDLAPADRLGYAPAHLWCAQQLLASPGLTSRDRRSAETHLLRALEGRLDDPGEAHLLLGELYLTARQFEQAREHLKQCANNGVAQLRLLQLAAIDGEAETIRERGEEIVKFFQTRSRQEPSSESARLYWAEAVMFLQEFEAALAILNDAQAKFPNSQRVHTATTTTYNGWLDSIDRDPKATPADRLTVLSRALAHDPSDAALLRRLWGLATSNGPECEKALALLREQLVEGKNLGMAHLALGTIDWENGRRAEGRLHMEQAFRAGPHVPVVGNNLAWMLAYADPPQYERALEIIDRVITTYPKEPRFRGTRGHILAKMRRWQEAVPDLEAALADEPNSPKNHEILAEAYSQLGDKELSSLHRHWKTKAVDPPSNGKLSPRKSP